MHQWDIVRVRVNLKDRDAHPAVVISCEEDCRDPHFLRVNVLYGSKKPPGAMLEPWQVMLNGADGLGEMATGLVGQGLAIFDSLRGGLGQHPAGDGSDQIGLDAPPDNQQ